jgi:hypothetical protein
MESQEIDEYIKTVIREKENVAKGRNGSTNKDKSYT